MKFLVDKCEKKVPLKFYAPRYWNTWVLLGLLRLIVLLPYSWQLNLGRWLGRLSLPFAKYRRHITEVNLTLCFPQLDDKQRKQLLIQCFESTAMGIIESAMAWWMPDHKLKKLAHYHMPPEVQRLLDQKKPILLCGAHFTCLEIAGRLFSMKNDYHLIYRHHPNPLFNLVMTKRRSHYVKKTIHRRDIRSLLKSIRSGIPVWYAPDQDYGLKHSVFAPFFGIPTATIAATSRLAKITQAYVIPVFYHRMPNNQGYELIALPPLDNFPTDDVVMDVTRLNQLLEQDLKQFPDQYLWQHRRFKTRPPGEKKIYLGKKKFK